MNPFIDVIIPTYNNPQQLVSCLQSIFMSSHDCLKNLMRVVVVNNGDSKLSGVIQERSNLKVIECGKNLGWEGGLKRGLEESKSRIVVFANDDIRFVQGYKFGLWAMLSLLNDPSVGAVGPCSNFVMGQQNIFVDSYNVILDVKFLIGFFMMLRREVLEKVGGIDHTLPGGDDIDLSIRLRDAGYRLLCRRDVFLYHHGAQTGQRVYEGYWNSPQMQEKTNLAIIRKHGMLKFWETMIMGPHVSSEYSDGIYKGEDVEGDVCRKFVIGHNVLEVGCGGKKTVAHAVAVDYYGAGEDIPFAEHRTVKSVADITADVSRDMPALDGTQDTIIARHILEHCQDTLGTLSVWNRMLKVGGRLIVAVPNNELGNTIMMNPEHILSFVPSSLSKLGKASGFKKIFEKTDINGVSFVMVFEKEFVPDFDIPNATILPRAAMEMEVV